MDRNGRPRVVPAGGRGPSRDHSSGSRALANGAGGGGDRLAREARPSPASFLASPAGRPTCWPSSPGTLDARAGQAAYDAVLAATRLALDGRSMPITTAPLQKEALHRAGHDYPGHTELLADLCGVDEFAMMLYLGPGRGAARPPGWPWSTSRCTRRCGTYLHELTEEAILAKARLADRVHVAADGQAAADRRLLAEPARRRRRIVRRRRANDHRGRPSSGEWPRACVWKGRCRPTR